RIRYANADIFDSPSTGVHAVHGAIRDEYNATASETDINGNVVQNLLGAPTSDETDVPGVPGARMNTFQGGAIYLSADNNEAHVVYGGIAAKYASLGGSGSTVVAYSDGSFGPGQWNTAGLGLPVRDEGTVPGLPGRRVTHFEGDRALSWAAGTRAHV